MTPDEALTRLRNALRALDVPTEDRDVFWGNGQEPMLSLAPGLIVWIGLRNGFRWTGPDWTLHRHPLDDAEGAAGKIFPLYQERTGNLTAIPDARPQ